MQSAIANRRSFLILAGEDNFSALRSDIFIQDAKESLELKLIDARNRRLFISNSALR